MSETPAPAAAAVELVRRYCENFVNKQDPSLCPELLVENYRLTIAGQTITDRDHGYKPLIAPLFAVFPDLHITLFELITDGPQVATRFTLQGSSTRHEGRTAAWGGVAIYGFDGRRFTSCWVEEDHHLMRAQLREGRIRVPEQPPAPDPWSAEPTPPDAEAARIARAWLTQDAATVVGREARLDALLVAGRRFAFHTTSPSVHVAGMATVDGSGAVTDLICFTNGELPA